MSAPAEAADLVPNFDSGPREEAIMTDQNDQNDQNETAELVGEITQAWREHEAEDAAKHPVTYDEASTGNIVHQMDRYRELTQHDALAGAIAFGKARGTYQPNQYVNEQECPPLTVAEHLEMIALGERIARYYRHQAQVHHAVMAGATWEQIAAATGGNAGHARQAYREWAEGQHRLREQFPGGTIGLDDDEYAAALEAADLAASGSDRYDEPGPEEG